MSESTEEPRGPQTASHGETIHLGKHCVEHDYVELRGAGHLEAGSAIPRHRDMVTLFGKSLLEQFSHTPLIFGDQNLHLAPNIAEKTERELKNASRVLSVSSDKNDELNL